MSRSGRFDGETGCDRRAVMLIAHRRWDTGRDGWRVCFFTLRRQHLLPAFVASGGGPRASTDTSAPATAAFVPSELVQYESVVWTTASSGGRGDTERP